MRIPKKPFDNYKWRWAVVTPTESLNTPPIFLGILRVLRANEYNRYSSEKVNHGLEIVQKETACNVNLVRTKERNIFRNSGQYWRGLGLLRGSSRGKIELTPFGRKLADGDITKVEFATTIIKTFTLPNKSVDNNCHEWEKQGIQLKPFEIILKLLRKLKVDFGNSYGYLSPEELINIVIPLAGDNGTLKEFVIAIVAYRNGSLDLSKWPNCTPKSNDRRMAREFLLFLHHYGFCNAMPCESNMKEKYFLANISVEEIDELYSLHIQETELERIERIIKHSHIPANVERKKVAREVLERPNQTKFRNSILEAYHSTCLVTGVKLERALEAAHIKPVRYNGTDQIFNGLCMRADIHVLFDSNHLRIHPKGELTLSTDASRKENYQSLPKSINLPSFIDKTLLEWRIKYY